MRKCIVLLIVFFFMGLAFAGAVSTDLKQSYRPGETLITKISGNILEPIKPEQVEFKRNNVVVPFPYDIKKLGADYYLWALMPANETAKNYTLIIKDLYTTVSGVEKKIDFAQNFSLEGNLTSYTIEPGFIYAKNDFEISIVLNKDENQAIDLDFPIARTEILKPGKNAIKFSIADIAGEQFLFIKVGDYSVPSYIIGNKTMQNAGNTLVQFRPRAIESIILATERNKAYPISIINFGDRSIENVYFQYDSDYFSIQPGENISLEPSKAYNFNLTLKKSSKDKISKVVYAKADNLSVELLVEIEFTENASKVSTPYLESLNNKSSYYCSELSGNICPSGEVCSGESVETLDGKCCLAKCESTKKSKRWIGYLIAGLVIIIVIYLYFRYKKSGIEKNIIQKKIAEAEKKMF